MGKTMKFSRYAKRFDSGSGTVQLMEDLGAARRTRGPVYMLGGGNPAHIPEVQSIFQREMLRIASDSAAFGRMVGDYDVPQGNVEFTTALASLLNRKFGWPLGPENIAITNGSQSSFGLIFNSLAGEFDDGRFRRVLLPITPEYIGYSDVGIYDKPLFEGHRPTIAKLPGGFFKYHIDLDSLTIDDRYGAVCVSRPTNPTGNVVTDAELQELARRCREADVPLVIDGAYGLPFPGIIFTEAQPLWEPNIILCLSLSKLGLPGVRAGIIVARPEFIRLVRNANAINSLAPGRVGPELVAALLEDDSLLDLCNEIIRPYYKRKMEHVVDCVRSIMGDLPVWIHQPEGALFVWLWFENLPITSEQLYQKLKDRGVFILAGHHFYPGLDEDWPHKYQCIRVNYATDIAVVEQGLKIIADTVRESYRAT